MRRKRLRNLKRTGVGKVVTGVLIGGVVGATMGWLTAPASGAEMRRRLRGEAMDVRKRAKTVIGNVERRARHLAPEVSQYGHEAGTNITGR